MCSRTLEKNIKLFLFRYISRALRRDPLRHERIAERTYSSHTVVVACDAASGRCNVHGDASLAMLGEAKALFVEGFRVVNNKHRPTRRRTGRLLCSAP